MNLKQSYYNFIEEKNDFIVLSNSFTRSIIEIDKNEWQDIKNLLENPNLNFSDKKIIEYRNSLYENGFLIDENKDEKKYLEFLYNENFFRTDFLNITINPTMQCNFSCPYCFEETKNNYMTEKHIEILKKFFSLNLLGKKAILINYFGGEPLLSLKLIIELENHLMELRKKYDLKINHHITTNGYLLDNDVQDILINKFHFNSFQITIDGCEKTHNITRKTKSGEQTFEKILKNFKKLIFMNDKNEIKINLRVNLLNNSINEVEEFLKLFNDDERKRFKIYFRPIYKTNNFNIENNNRNNLLDFYKMAENLNYNINNNLPFSYCYCEGDGGSNTIEIKPDLSIWKCINDENCSTSNFAFIDNDGKMIIDREKLIKWKLKDPFKSDECSKCKYLPLCFGGCPLRFLNNNERTCYYEKEMKMYEQLIIK